MSNNIEINFAPTTKQHLMFEHFNDDVTTEILYGGSAGAAKSYGICALIILKCLEYPGIRVGLARNELTTLKKTTVVSFFEVATAWNLIPDVHFQYNSTAGIIKFSNGSEVILFELSYKPSDPNFTRLGGHLLTFGCVDELGEVEEQGFQIFKTRLGRWKNEQFKIKPIVISTCNPSKNWIYREYYKASIENRLKPYQVFIQALPTDNPHIPKSYLDNLKKLPYAERERLLFGNWDYDDNPQALLRHEQIVNIWDNVPEIEKPGQRYISADIAFTSDKMVIMVWDEMTIIDCYVSPKGNIEEFILSLATQYGVPNNHIAYDSDGVGKFLTTRLRNARPIVNNSAAVGKENYKNLKTQMYFKLAEEIKKNKVKMKQETFKSDIIEELQVIEHKPSDVVGKIEMVDKGDVKRKLGRSPDFSDCMAYRMVFEVNPARSTVVFGR